MHVVLCVHARRALGCARVEGHQEEDTCVIIHSFNLMPAVQAVEKWELVLT
jgi:hypothetical protein